MNTESIKTAEIAEWRIGATKFAGFISRTTPEERELMQVPGSDGLYDKQRNLGDLQALFLGEKAMSVVPFPITENMVEIFSDLDVICLNPIGFASERGRNSNVVYRKDLVRKTMQENADLFDLSMSEDQTISSVAANPEEQNWESRMKFGILLGYPRGACERFAALNKQKSKLSEDNVELIKEGTVGKIALIQTVYYEAYGIVWADFPNKPESEAYQQNLKVAFETSGILDVEL